MASLGIMSIPPAPRWRPERSFNQFYQELGSNTGNLLFTNAVWNLPGEKKRIGFHFEPGEINEQCDHLIIPAANWLCDKFDFGYLADQIEKLTIPVTVIGLGAQSPNRSTMPVLPEGTIRFAKAISAHGESISVRGAFTKTVLSRLGVRNVRVTGCPSLFREYSTKKAAINGPLSLRRTLLHSTRYAANHPKFFNTPSINRDLFRFAYRHETDLLYQSEPEELAMCLSETRDISFDETIKAALIATYGAPGWAALADYIRTRGRAFTDINAWSSAVRDYQFVFGTRLHGTIMALNSGTPAMLICHDSRTLEMARLAKIPHLSSSGARMTEDFLAEQYARLKLDPYYLQRDRLRTRYQAFLRENRIIP